MRRTLRALSALVVTLLLIAGCSSDAAPGGEESSSAPVVVKGSVVTTGPSENEMQVSVPGAIIEQWNALGANGEGVEWVSNPHTDAAVQTTPIALGTDGQQEFIDKINATQSGGTQRTLLDALLAIKSPAGTPVWVFSPLLDTKDPLDFNQLAFDETPADVVKKIKKAGDLPELKGRPIHIVVTPTAGAQEAPTDQQVSYIRAVWEGLLKAADAKRIDFYDGAGTTPGLGAGPVVKIPSPEDIEAEVQGTKVVCTLPTPALFAADQATLLDKPAVLKALKKCTSKAGNATRIIVEGHTAGDPDSSNAFAKSLSTRRATEVAAALKELGVKAKNIEKVVGYGPTKPLVKPGTDPKNRAVVVTFTVPD